MSYHKLSNVIGPIAKNMDDLVYTFKGLVDSASHISDPSVVPIPFQEAEYNCVKTEKLTVGYYVHDGFFRATPPVARAVTKSVQVLREAGHTCIGLFEFLINSRNYTKLYTGNVDIMPARFSQSI
jgi:Asp-tRNA(Asn)/Glu-tRNA(Gln) amidotransferase A subunit family amidase